MKTFIKIALFVLVSFIFGRCAVASTVHPDSVVSWKKQAVRLNLTYQTFMAAKAYASKVAMPVIPNDSVVQWKKRADRLNITIDAYLLTLISQVSCSAVGSYIPLSGTSATIVTGVVSFSPSVTTPLLITDGTMQSGLLYSSGLALFGTVPSSSVSLNVEPSNNRIKVSGSANFMGIDAPVDYSPYYNTHTYVQNSYVKNNFFPYTGALSSVVTPYGITSNSLAVTGAGAKIVLSGTTTTQGYIDFQRTGLATLPNTGLTSGGRMSFSPAGHLIWTNASDGYTRTLSTPAFTTHITWLMPAKSGTVTLNTDFAKGSFSLDFPSTSANASSDLTVTVTGAVLSDVVVIGVPNVAMPVAAASYTAWVSSANTVTIRFINASSSSLDPATGTFNITLIKL